jgi:hypothetical protein
VLAVVIGLSLWFVNLFGAIMLFLFTGAYILFSLTKNKHIMLTIRDTGFVVDTRLWPWQHFENFVVEVDGQTQERKNIIFVLKKNDNMIFSFDDTHENKQAFLNELQTYISMADSAPHGTLDTLVRKLKL